MSEEKLEWNKYLNCTREVQLNIVLENVISVDFYVAGCCKICLKRQSNTPKTRRIPNSSHIFWSRITSPCMYPLFRGENNKKKTQKLTFLIICFCSVQSTYVYIRFSSKIEEKLKSWLSRFIRNWLTILWPNHYPSWPSKWWIAL